MHSGTCTLAWYLLASYTQPSQTQVSSTYEKSEGGWGGGGGGESHHTLNLREHHIPLHHGCLRVCKQQAKTQGLKCLTSRPAGLG